MIKMFLHNTLKGQTIPLSFSIVGIKRTLVISDLQVILIEKLIKNYQSEIVCDQFKHKIYHQGKVFIRSKLGLPIRILMGFYLDGSRGFNI